MKLRGEILFEEFLERFGLISDEELIQVFNKEVENNGWGTARAAYLSAIHNEFERRFFDYSEIGNIDSLSFNNQIVLNDKKISILKGI